MAKRKNELKSVFCLLVFFLKLLQVLLFRRKGAAEYISAFSTQETGKAKEWRRKPPWERCRGRDKQQPHRICSDAVCFSIRWVFVVCQEIYDRKQWIFFLLAPEFLCTLLASAYDALSVPKLQRKKVPDINTGFFPVLNSRVYFFASLCIHICLEIARSPSVVFLGPLSPQLVSRVEWMPLSETNLVSRFFSFCWRKKNFSGDSHATETRTRQRWGWQALQCFPCVEVWTKLCRWSLLPGTKRSGRQCADSRQTPSWFVVCDDF